MQRYLLRFSYRGDAFKGFQKQQPRVPLHLRDVRHQFLERHTVQGAIEDALWRLRPKNEVVLLSSSRTDSGVHALENASTVDLEVRETDNPPKSIHKRLDRAVGVGRDGKKYFDPILVTRFLNKILQSANVPIRSVV